MNVLNISNGVKLNQNSVEGLGRVFCSENKESRASTTITFNYKEIVRNSGTVIIIGDCNSGKPVVYMKTYHDGHFFDDVKGIGFNTENISSFVCNKETKSIIIGVKKYSTVFIISDCFAFWYRENLTWTRF